MKEYVKLFDTPVSANDYEILDIPFITTIESTGQNLHCNELAKKLVNNNGVVSVVDDAVTITGTWNPSVTHNRKKAIISGDVILTGKTDCYSLTFETGGHLTINAGARLRIWQGGITNNDCTTVNYLTLKVDGLNNTYSQFLLHPDVTSNTHPNATVEFKSKSYTEGSGYAKQIFGIPTHTKLTEITAKYNNAEVATGFEYFDYSASAWKTAGYIHMAGQTIDYDKIGAPFTYYRMQHNTPNMGTIVTMKGALVGNESPTLVIFGNSWKGFSNSFTAPIKTEQLLSLLSTHNITSINVRDNNDKYIEINSQNVSQCPYIQPLCEFLIRNTGAQFNTTLSYKDLVWDPSFEEEVTPTRGLMKGALITTKPSEAEELPDDPIFQDPGPIEFESLTLENNLK